MNQVIELSRKAWSDLVSKVSDWVGCSRYFPLVVPAFLLCLTPLACWPAFTRAPVYNFLVKLDTHGQRTRRGYGLSQPGRTVWWLVNRPFMVGAMASLPIGIPIFLWFWVGLAPHWTASLSNKIDVAQLLSSAVLGGVAIDIFLWFQLPRILCPSVHVATVNVGENCEHYVRSEVLQGGKICFLVFRIVNTGTTHFRGLHIVIRLPTAFLCSRVERGPGGLTARMVPSGEVVPTEEYHPVLGLCQEYEYLHGTREIVLGPLRLAQGEDTVVSVIVVPPSEVQTLRTGVVWVRASSEDCFGTCQLRLQCGVQPEAVILESQT